MISIPSPSACCSSFIVCGCASAIMINARHNNLQMNGRCLNDVFHDPKPFAATAETGMDDLLLFFLYTYQTVNMGNKINKAKAQGLPKIISLK
jgi:hypothetical protein